MTQDDESFLKRLLATFKVEADEHVAAMSSLLLELEQPAAPELAAQRIEALFREAHSLKGAARSVNLADIERVCQALERVLSTLKRGELALSADLLAALNRTLDGLTQLLARDVGGQPMPDAVPASRLVHALEAVPGAADLPEPAGQAEPAAHAVPLSAGPGADTVRIAATKLEALLLRAEDLQAFKFSADHLAEEQHALGNTLFEWRREWNKSARHARVVQRALAKPGHAAGDALAVNLRALAQVFDAVERDELFIKSLGERFAQLERVAAQERRALAGVVDKLLDDMKQALMLPFASFLEGMPKLVRDLARDSGKEVDLTMQGTALEIDRRLLEQMKTPLIHLLRNAVDHGIESPDERRRAGKPARGRIAIEVAAREGNRIELVVADDGAGIDVQRVKAKASQLGLQSAAGLAAMSDAQACVLVFESGLSTSPLLTDLSGHGLGLAIVREKVERLGGTVELSARSGAGTRFVIVLPATLATFRGLLVGVGDHQFVLPSRSVERVARVKEGGVRTVANRESIELDGQALSLVRLAAVLGLPERGPARRDDGHLPLAVLAHGGRRMAFAVDEVIGDQEVLVKPLGPPLKRVRNVAGATVLGAGRVVPLLNVADLLKSALHAGAARAAPAAAARAPEAPPRSLLVVEDSITSRALLKGILESAGYRVSTAVDGMDALTRLQTGRFDLVVSDVEMPRMDGFELTTRIRADKRLTELPVVLVTALGSREDKERGVEVGANAYIVKSSFDQANLVDVIGALV
ncbi:hybrid sensor histidine kinase/response regulator [Piscinibacter sp.]|uniref:hybrid sensor histidine kinase/response regulator n=1 Tax=Piscinibacter sp. TaxID=1903157 RepID=UPI002F4158D9